MYSTLHGHWSIQRSGTATEECCPPCPGVPSVSLFVWKYGRGELKHGGWWQFQKSRLEWWIELVRAKDVHSICSSDDFLSLSLHKIFCNLLIYLQAHQGHKYKNMYTCTHVHTCIHCIVLIFCGSKFSRFLRIRCLLRKYFNKKFDTLHIASFYSVFAKILNKIVKSSNSQKFRATKYTCKRYTVIARSVLTNISFVVDRVQVEVRCHVHDECRNVVEFAAVTVNNTIASKCFVQRPSSVGIIATEEGLLDWHILQLLRFLLSRLQAQPCSNIQFCCCLKKPKRQKSLPITISERKGY